MKVSLNKSNENLIFQAPWSPYWAHLKEAWALKDHPNLLFLFYEDMMQVSILMLYM